MAMALQQYDKAHAMLGDGLPMLREAGDPYRIAMGLNFRDNWACCEQNYVEAEPGPDPDPDREPVDSLYLPVIPP